MPAPSHNNATSTGAGALRENRERRAHRQIRLDVFRLQGGLVQLRLLLCRLGCLPLTPPRGFWTGHPNGGMASIWRPKVMIATYNAEYMYVRSGSVFSQDTV